MRGTIWWDFDGTLVSRPFMWSGAAKRLVQRASIACEELPGPLLDVLNSDMPWHGANRAHPELNTPDIVAGLGISTFFADVITSGLVGYEKPLVQMFEAAVRGAIPGAPIWMIGDNAECDCDPVGAFGARAIRPRG